MDAAFGWLGEIFNALLRLFPRIVVVRSTHKGVKFVRGRKIKVMHSGLHFYWPLVTEIAQIPVVRRTMQLSGQTITTNNTNYIVTTAIVYKITDIVTALTEVAYIQQALEDISQGCVMAVLTAHRDNGTLSQSKIDDLRKEMLLLLRKRTAKLGVGIIDLVIVDFSQIFPVRLFNEYSVGESN